MNLEEAIKKVNHYWYFTDDELFELGEMLEELEERREQEDKEDKERSLEVERDDWEREDND